MNTATANKDSEKFVAANFPGEVRMLDVFRSRLKNAHDISICVSFLRFSGMALIIDDLKQFLARDGRVRIVTSTYLGITQPEALQQLLLLNGIECKLHVSGAKYLNGRTTNTGFHTKLFIFKNGNKECWVGSSNLTKGGLVSNIEANLCQQNSAAISDVENVFDIIWKRDDVLPLNAELVAMYADSLKSFIPPSKSDTTPEIIVPELISKDSFSRCDDDLPTHFSNSYETASFKLPQEFHEPSKIERIKETFRPNEAQIEALLQLKELRNIGEKRAVVVAAPGIGKTFLAAFDARQCGAKSLLLLSHRLEHLSQAKRTFEKVVDQQITCGLLYGEVNQSYADFIFATVQSASRNSDILNRKFDYVIIDEFHHAEAPSYQRVLEKISASFLLGLTATPERQDGHDVLKLCDYNVAYEVRLVQAINRGWLTPFHYFGISDDTVDYSSIPWRSNGFDITALENALMLEERVEEILKHALEKGYDGLRRATVGFCAGIKHAKFMADSFNRRGYKAIAITGEHSLEYREQSYKQFSDPSNELEWLFVADVLNEGVDIPAINSILFLRPTESATIFIQQLGRGLRLCESCEVLTVIDFVGHHRSAWLTMTALHDQDAGLNYSSIPELKFTPPSNCEVILDQKTLQILAKLLQHSQSKKELCLNAYSNLKSESPRPYPLDLWGREDCPDIGTFRTAFKSWIGVRKAANDAESWEISLEEESLTYKFLLSLERDWQQGRVYSYALVWGLSIRPDLEPSESYNLFFDRFPRWEKEKKPLESTKAWQTVAKKLAGFLDGNKLKREILSNLPVEKISDEIEGRIRLTLEKDYKLRHGGILRLPSDLVLHRRYDRAEIINHFREQYDPARHNFGVIYFKQHTVIIAKIDTSGAMQNHQYSNYFINEKTFAWQSQNQQRQDNTTGRKILDHKKSGDLLHLFVQAKSHEKAYYCGTVSVLGVKGDAPMNVTFDLDTALSSIIYLELTDSKDSESNQESNFEAISAE